MKKVFTVLLIVWSGFTSFVSPIWLTLIYLNLTGLIYKYDYSMDEGTAGIFGIVLAVLWIVFAMIPNVATMKMMYNKDRRLAVVYLIAVAILCLCCFAMCGWNIMRFLV